MKIALKFRLAIFLKVLGITLFILVAAFLIVKALGYQIDSRFFKLTKTGLISIKTDPRQAKIYLDNKLKGERAPVRLDNLLPAWYDVKIEKEGYQTWQKRVKVGPAEAVALDNILLFLEKPVIEPIEEVQGNLLEKLTDLNPSPELQIKNQNEIWLEDKFFSRFSKPVEKVLFYPDNEHIAFVSGGFLQIIDKDPTGGNNKTLLPLPTNTPFIFLEEGKVVIYQEGSRFFRATIR